MMAQYKEKLHSDPAASLQGALQAWRMGPNADSELAVRTALDADTERLILRADPGGLGSSEFSPDGLTLLTAGSDGLAKLFNAFTGELIRSFEPPETERPPLQYASASDDGATVLTVSTTGTVHLYDIAGRDLGVLIQESGANATWGTLGASQVVLTFGGDQPATLWDAQHHKAIATYGSSSAYDATLSPDGRHVLTAEYEGYQAVISVWDAKSGRPEQRSHGMRDAASPQFASVHSGKVAFFANDESSGLWQVMLWDWQKGPKPRGLDKWSREPARIVVSRDRHFIAVPLDKFARVINADTGDVIATVPEHADWVNDIAFSADGNWLVTGGNDGKAMVWNAHISTNRPIAELLGHRGSVLSVQFDPHNPWRITTAGSDGTARTWEVPPRAVLAGDWGWILDADVSRNGQIVATAEELGLRIYEFPSGGLSHEWRQVARTNIPGDGNLESAKFTPDGQTVVSARWWDFAPWAWAWGSGGEPVMLEAANGFLRKLAVSSDGATIAAGDSTNRVSIWNLSSGKIIEELGQESDKNYQITDVRYLPHSSLIAAASTEGTIRLFDPDVSQQSLRTLGDIGDSPITALDVTADGNYLASVSDDRAIRIWRISDGELVQTIGGPQNTIADVTFSPDGTVVAVAAADAAVHLWRWQDNYKLAVLQRHGDSVNSVKFFPDGSTIISTSDDGTAAIYPCTTCQPFMDVLAMADQQDRNRG